VLKNMISEPVIQRIENAVRKVNCELDSKKPIGSWRKMSENELFSEISSCIIGSRITFEKAKNISDALAEENLLCVDVLAEMQSQSRRKIHAVLKREKCLYARAKATYIVKTAENLYLEAKTSIKTILKKSENQYEARGKLTELCLGIGLKQASLFLRNIHYADELAILDTHVLSYMQLVGLEAKKEKALTSKRYLDYENKLREYSQKFNTSIAMLDVSIWVVMRTMTREFKWMLSY